MSHPKKRLLCSIIFISFALIFLSGCTDSKKRAKAESLEFPEPIPMTAADWNGIQKAEIQTDAYLFVGTQPISDNIATASIAGGIVGIVTVVAVNNDSPKTKAKLDEVLPDWRIDEVFHNKLSQTVHNQTTIPVQITPSDYNDERIVAVTSGYDKRWKERMKDVVKISTDPNVKTFSISIQARLSGTSSKPNLSCWAFWMILPPGNHTWEEIGKIRKSNKYFDTRRYILDCGTKKRDEWFIDNGILLRQTIESAMDEMSLKICKDISLPIKQETQISIKPVESRE